MAFLEHLTLSPLRWCIWLIIGIIATMLTGLVAFCECKKRQSETSWFASDYLKITSAISIGCGSVAALQSCLDILPGFCMIQYTLSPIARQTQFIFMGFYQLSRLHYCFSKTSSHHQNGYPKWLFIVMVSVGIILLILWSILLSLGHPLPSTCGFQGDSSFEWEYKDSSILFAGNLEVQKVQFYHWYYSIVAITLAWDITTLSLYCYKIKTFRSNTTLSQDAVWRKIIFVLQRIIIINLFYQISILTLKGFGGTLRHIPALYMWLLYTMKIPIHNVIVASLTVLYSISMYLMLEHNTDEYLRFLRCLKKSYLKYVSFCCCHRIVDNQLQEFESIALETKMEEKDNECKSMTSTWFQNPSKNVMYSSNRNRACSSPTVTVQLEDEQKE